MGHHVLYLSYDGMTDPLGQSQVIPYLDGLAAKGHRIEIVSAEKKNKLSENGEAIRQQLTAATIAWHPVEYSNDFPLLSQYGTYKRLRRKSFQLHHKIPFSIVHCRSYIPSLIGLELKRKEQTKFIFDMRGFWADERIEGGIWKLRNPLYKSAYHFFKRKEKEFLRESDAIISLTENAKQAMLLWKELSLVSEKISVISCCADLDLFSEKSIDLSKQEQIRSELHIDKDDFVISYSGSIGTWYLADEMLRFFRILNEEKQNSKFLLITPDEKEKILSVAANLGLGEENLIIRSAKRAEMPLLLSLSDASIFFIKNSFSKKASSPTKMGEVMGLGIPIICNKGVGDVDSIMRKSNAGVLVESYKEDDLKKGARQLLEEKFSKEEIRRGAENFFSLEKGIQHYDKIYNSLDA